MISAARRAWTVSPSRAVNLIVVRCVLRVRCARLIWGRSEASGNDASLFETEIATASRSRRTDDDVIKQLNLQDPAGLENSPGEPHIGFGRGRVSRGMIVHHYEGLRGVRDHWLKDFSWMG
jgi:hypothetical protein